MTIQIVNKGKPFIFDSEDWRLVSRYRWHVDKHGYVVVTTYENGVCTGALKMHRLILGLSDPKIQGDHINHIRTDNRRINLRVADAGGNARNTTAYGEIKSLGVIKTKIGKYNKSPGYVARITYNRKPYYLGKYKTEKQAALAYNEAAKKYFGEFANLNNV